MKWLLALTVALATALTPAMAGQPEGLTPAEGGTTVGPTATEGGSRVEPDASSAPQPQAQPGTVSPTEEAALPIKADLEENKAGLSRRRVALSRATRRGDSRAVRRLQGEIRDIVSRINTLQAKLDYLAANPLGGTAESQQRCADALEQRGLASKSWVERLFASKSDLDAATRPIPGAGNTAPIAPAPAVRVVPVSLPALTPETRKTMESWIWAVLFIAALLTLVALVLPTIASMTQGRADAAAAAERREERQRQIDAAQQRRDQERQDELDRRRQERADEIQRRADEARERAQEREGAARLQLEMERVKTERLRTVAEVVNQVGSTANRIGGSEELSFVISPDGHVQSKVGPSYPPQSLAGTGAATPPVSVQVDLSGLTLTTPTGVTTP